MRLTAAEKSLGRFVTRDIHVGSSWRDIVRHVHGKLVRFKGKPAMERRKRKRLYRAAFFAVLEHRQLMRLFRL